MAGKGHTLEWEPANKHVRVEFAGTTIVDTDAAYVLNETGIPPVYYVPLSDVRAEFLERTDHSTNCPFKGDASYWSVVVGDERAENALWGYEDPIENARYLQGYGAFYTNRVDVSVG